MDNLTDCLNDISKINTIYIILLLASVGNIRLFTTNDGYIIDEQVSNCNQSFGIVIINYLIAAMNYNSSSEDSLDVIYDGDGSSPTTSETVTSTSTSTTTTIATIIPEKPCLLIRLAKRLASISENLIVYLENQFNEHTATSIASFSVLIIVLTIICCFIIRLMREEEKKIKEQYKKLNTGSSQSFIAINGASHRANVTTSSKQVAASLRQIDRIDSTQSSTSSSSSSSIIKKRFIGSTHKNDRSTSKLIDLNKFAGGLTSYLSSPINGSSYKNYTTIGSEPFKPSASSSSHHNKVHIIELRRETYFGLLRLLKPGCRTIVLFCDNQSKLKLLSKFYQCIYPYRKTKTIHFAFLLIEKNIGWYKDLLKLALNEKRDLQINPINCIGTVLVLSGFKKYFSVYHASDSRCDPDEQFILEESLLDNFPDWLERLFAGKVSRYYVECWPDGMR